VSQPLQSSLRMLARRSSNVERALAACAVRSAVL
jgi:hypothetical protein